MSVILCAAFRPRGAIHITDSAPESIMNRPLRYPLLLLLALFVSACSSTPQKPPVAVSKPPARIALVLGGGAARGFAHVGVIKILEANQIKPDLVVGTSAGSLVGALYAAGYSGFDLQRIVLDMGQFDVFDLSLPDRGFVKGEKLQDFVNTKVRNRPIEALPIRFIAVATEARSGRRVDFARGNTGQAVRASSSIPGVFRPVAINGHEYVDGGVVSPVPVLAARAAGANFVIAVDISPDNTEVLASSLGVLNQSARIMGKRIAAEELKQADVVIRPQVGEIGLVSFDRKNEAVMEGERAALAALPAIRAGLARFAPRPAT